MFAGDLIGTLALWNMSNLTPADSLARVWLSFSLSGVALGLFEAANMTEIMAAAPASAAGVVGGLIAAARTTGMMLGVALSAALFAARQGDHLAAGLLPEAAFAAALVAAVAAAVALAHAVRRRVAPLDSNALAN